MTKKKKQSQKYVKTGEGIAGYLKACLPKITDVITPRHALRVAKRYAKPKKRKSELEPIEVSRDSFSPVDPNCTLDGSEEIAGVLRMSPRNYQRVKNRFAPENVSSGEMPLAIDRQYDGGREYMCQNSGEAWQGWYEDYRREKKLQNLKKRQP